MFDKEITFDRFIRGLLIIVVAILLGLLINRLSTVLIPFFVAWLLAYLMHPLVVFLQYKCRIRNRILSIVLAILLVLAVLGGSLALIIPPTVREFSRLSVLINQYLQQYLGETKLSDYIQDFVEQYANSSNLSILEIVQHSSFMEALQGILSQAWVLLTGTVSLAFGILGSLITLLYLFFILMDYEAISNGWIRLIPQQQRHLAQMISGDVRTGMNAYFRGQALIALLVGILFSIGFLIIDFPLAIGLGLFIGFLNLVPYMQIIGFLPTILLALIKSAETGQNFWFILLLALIVFAVVQTIQDMILTPNIMGHVMGLNPAVILLSLSIWGSLLGIIGFIIALPLTTLLLSYYRRFVLKEDIVEPEKSPINEKKSK